MDILSANINPVVGVQVTLNATTPRPYDPTIIIYDPLPFDFVFTDETQPQVLVSVDGLPAVCACNYCGYTYTVPAAQITSYSLNGAQNVLTINGVSFEPNIVSVNLGSHACTVTSSSSTQIVCSLTPVAGDWEPVVIDNNGIVPAATSSLLQVPLIVNSVTPTQVNPFGGNLLTISGRNFPATMADATQFTITFSNGSPCEIQSTSPTTITCITGPYNPGTPSSTMTVQVNSKSDSSISVSLGSQNPAIQSMEPTMASPVLKTPIFLHVNNWVHQLIKSDLSVQLIGVDHPEWIEPLNIVALSNVAGSQYIQVMYGGAYSGNYSVKVTSAQYGNFDTTGIYFQAIGTVTSWSPNQGSVHGGTLLTINGYNFSSGAFTDNPVQVGYTDCLVKSTSNTQITCMTQPRRSAEAGTDDLIVFLRTFEMAVFQVNETFTWVAEGLPNVTNSFVYFDTTSGDWILAIEGENFGTDPVEVNIDGLAQTTLTVNNSMVTVQIDQTASDFSSNVDIYFAIGSPAGQPVSIQLAPVLLSISPQVISPAGSIIEAVVPGVGPKSVGVTLVNAAGVSICVNVIIPSYGQVLCQTKPGVITTQDISVKQNGVGSSCAGSVGACSLETSSSMPSVSNVVMTDANTLTFTGTNFFTSGFNGAVNFGGVLADTVSVSSDTSATATFNNGIPLTTVAQAPQFMFNSTSSPVVHWASPSTTILNTLSAASIQSSVTCSFAGGCQVTVNQPGLLASLKSSSSNSLNVCYQRCTPSAASTTSVLQCSLPALPTVYSIKNYNITSKDTIKGTIFGSNTQLAKQMFDGDNLKPWTSGSANCVFGTSFNPGYVGIVTQVSYFMNRFTSANIVNRLNFQGSMDGVTYTTIFTVGPEVHNGWNFQKYEDGQELTYRYYRFFGEAANSCLGVGEVKLLGVTAIQDNTASYSSCPIQLTLNNTVTTLSGSVTYAAANTPLLTSVTPRFGNVKGGDVVTFTGINFSGNTADYTIQIDGKTCAVSAATSTSVTCTTAPRPGLYDTTTLSININGMGTVATQGLLFRYCSLWSDDSTWGGEFAPIEGDMVYIPPGLKLLVDVDSTPVLSAVLVEGSLIFPSNLNPDHERTFDASYIMVRGGYMEVGTEEFPYTSKLTITMHSIKTDPHIPMYGNKVIAVRNGVLDMHGVPRTPTWTSLGATANPGDMTITLITAVDWKVGESIVIAPTSYESTEAEERKITSIDNSNPTAPVITLDTPLQFKHFSGIQTFANGDFIEMRAEVGLLTRNVVFRGDPSTSIDNQYGGHIMLCSHGDESLIGRIEYIELQYVGQAFQLGRYPIHFHMIGTVYNSYVNGNSIHDTYNRAVTIHHVWYLRVTNNVAYNTMGHTFFIEDGIETNNLLQNNLAIQTKQSFSLLNTDQTPASFWITNPDNIFMDNHAAGSVRYGFWFDTQPNPTGPSFTTTVCPNRSPLGGFSNNVAHSNGKYGLRIFHQLMPAANPCGALIYDAKNVTDPYWQTPLVTAHFVNFTSYKNKFNGAIAEQVGDVRFENFKVADNLVAGIEVSLTDVTMDGTAQINGAVVIGHSINADSRTTSTFSHGIITPRYENFQVHNVHFHNFDVAGKAAIGSCSHCFHSAATDSGARTVTFSNLQFDSSVTKKIQYQYPFKDIFYDLDGTLTGLGAKSWATPYFAFNEQPECQVDLAVYDGLLCNSSVQVRRIAFHKYAPSYFEFQPLLITQMDSPRFKALNQSNITEVRNYKDDSNNYGQVPFKAKKDPSNAWAFPIVTGHKYLAHWGFGGLDFTTMTLNLSPKWQATDLDVIFAMNFSTKREQVDFITNNAIVPNMSYGNATKPRAPPPVYQTADNVVYNETGVQLIYMVMNGKNQSKSTVLINAYECAGGSCLPPILDKPLETTVRYWSNVTSWPSGLLPKDGDDVVIESGWNMVFDLPQSPLLNSLEINGHLTFDITQPTLELRAQYIFVRAGALIIGNETDPFPGQAQITLSGQVDSVFEAYSNQIQTGNEQLSNTALLKLFGLQRSRFSRLTKPAIAFTNTIQVSPGLDWVSGDQISLFPTGTDFYQSDYAIITSYDSSTGDIVLDRALSYNHFGAPKSTASKYNGVDIRGEVVLLSRNVRIVGNVTDYPFGCQVITTDFIEADGVFRNGNTLIDSVEIYNCSQYSTFSPALRFEGAMGAYSQVTNSAVHHGLGKGANILSSVNILFENNTIYDHKYFGLNVQSSTNITVKGNLIGMIHPSGLQGSDMVIPLSGGIVMCGADEGDFCQDIFVQDNIVAGTTMVGFVAPAHQCGLYRHPIFKNNTAHSIQGNGAQIFRHPADASQSSCLEGSHFAAYKCSEAGATTYPATERAIFSSMTLIDNNIGVAVNVGQEGNNLEANLKDSVFFGDSEIRDCQVPNQCGQGWWTDACNSRSAVLLSYFTQGAKAPMIKKASSLPYYESAHSAASFGGKIYYSNISFNHFDTSTYCGAKQSIFSLNPVAPDYAPRATIEEAIFNNVSRDALVHLMSPPKSWANLDDCGNFPCTGPNNTYLSFVNSEFTGSVLPTTFQVVPNNPQLSANLTRCSLVQAWNAYLCQNKYLGILVFESLDSDNWKRMISPITVKSYNITSSTTLNTFMDHFWDGFYTSQLRLSRWPAIVQTGINNNAYYEILYTGTAPNKQRFRLNADAGAVTVKIQYTNPSAYVIQDANGKVIPANSWDKSINQPGLIKGDKGGFCGENRYRGVVNILEFYIRPDCGDLYIVPIDSIQVAVRMNWTMNQFYADGGTTTFSDRLAASLGISAQNIKTVSVYTGSVVVQFFVTDDAKAPILSSESQNLTTVYQRLTQRLQSPGTLNLGAPIIGADLQFINTTKLSDPTSYVTLNPFPTTLPGSKTPKVTPVVTPGTTSTTTTQTTIIQTNTTELVAAETGSNPLLVGIVIGVIAGVILLSAISIFIWRKCTQKKEFIETEDAPRQVPNTSNIGVVSMSPSKVEDTFEVQYHPKTEFGNIFGRGDPFYKGNNADNIYEEDDEEDIKMPVPTDHSVYMVTNSPDHNMQDDTPMHNMQEIPKGPASFNGIMTPKVAGAAHTRQKTGGAPQNV